MSYLGNEETLVEIPAIEYLRDKLDYQFVHGQFLTPEYGERDSMTEVILKKRLEKALKRLNPWMNDTNINKAIRYLTRPENLGVNLYDINEKIYDAIVNLSYSLEQDLDGSGKKKYYTIKFIDWHNIDNNEFLVTRQFKVHGPNENIIPDIVIFINGIPVVVLECKSPFLEKSKNENMGKYEAFNQLQRYMNARGGNIVEGAERLFYTNFITGILNKYHGYIGTISSTYQFYQEWKDPYPFKIKDIDGVEDNGQNIFLHGVLEKENLVDIMQNFILFESGVKKVCRYQQFRAVNKALKRLIKGKDSISRGGVIWHTQGSGKSLTMVFLARKIRKIKELMDATIVVVTDRIDLDKQIYNTFVRTLSNITTPVRADSVASLKELLSLAQPQIIMTTIHKFQGEKEDKEVLKDSKQKKGLYFEKEFPVLTTKSNVIVLADEAHRSQYKTMAKNMRNALPNAAFIGFTGTPIDKKDKSTVRTFGKYIDKYGIKQAVEDGATVKIVYEGRKPELQIKGDTLEELFDEAFGDRSDEEKEAIKQKYANKRTIVEADERIEDIAKDILTHYKEQIYPNGFKAQVVCVSRDACVKYYNALNKYMGKIIGEKLEVKIIFSGSPNDEPYLKEHHTTKAEQDEIIKRFKQPIDKDKLCFIIVKDMLLTGFDAPIEQVMYLDRPLKEHNLLQAIARVNRTYGDSKKCGYVVDYYGISNHLEEALAIFDKEELGQPMESLDSIYNQMLSYREAVMNMFRGVDKDDLDSLVRKIEPEDKRAEFELAYKRFASTMEQLLPSRVPTNMINDLRWLTYIRAAAKARFEPQNKLDIAGCGGKVKKIISEHLKSKGVEQWIEPITLFDSNFNIKINKLESDEAVASSMEHAIKHVINVRMDENPVHYTSLLEKLKKILDETKNNWIERKNKLKEFIENDIQKGEIEEAEALGLTKEEYAFFQTVKKHLKDDSDNTNIVKEEGEDYISNEIIELSKSIAKDVSEIVKENYVIDWTTNPSKTSDIEREIYLTLTKKYFKKLKLEIRKQLVQPLLNLAKKHYAVLD
ncbi:type I restriction endonuclease subunit R [Thermohalobacter berrensis]|uniref:Type I restriction enzyme endonuclease subunit n=1 Tax=Thermohalobacter berrensis TaxID=99594 RepID=A0A419T9L2_9FIRM|nr:type I restriction endonuclease subunit R [Thermohalobacter berrensis]RKD34171.1 restriction endonuclease subunit R [Thermohalobacter berrensis]